MPKVTLTFTETNPMPEGLKAFKTSDTTAEVWVNSTQEALASELNPTLEAHKNTILAEKGVLEDKYKALVSTSGKNEVDAANLIAAAKTEAKNAINETDKKLLDAIKTVKADATPEFVTEAIKEYPIVTEKLNVMETTKTNDAIFEASGYKNRTVFDTVFSNAALNPNFDSVVWKDEKDTAGNPVKNPYIKVKTAVDGKVELPISDYAQKTPEWAGFMPSLTGTVNQQNQWTPANPTNQQQQSFTQSSGLPTNPFFDAVAQGQAKIQQASQPAEKGTQGDNK